MNHLYVITAAGGNATAIRLLEKPLSRAEYETRGRQLMSETESLGAEQCGFLLPADHHLEMSGGEFCGNASRAAAVLFSVLDNAERVHFTVSGFKGTVSGTVQPNGERGFLVECTFPGLPTTSNDVTVLENQAATLVDLGGIVHVVIRAPFPEDPKEYQRQHRSICRELKLEDRDAVGVIWIEEGNGSVTMHPVVWVKGIDTFFYETSCGSGTIAVGKTTGVRSIIQPSRQIINATISDGEVTLQSEMEITHELP